MGVELVHEFVHTVLLTGKVKDCSPVSAVLIAAPETGKTSIALERPCEAYVAVTRATAKGLEFLLMQQPKATHIILSDLTYVGAMGARASRNFFEMVKPMVEEGVRTIADPSGVKHLPGGKMAILGCLTPELAKDHRAWWWKQGLASRLIPFHYDYPAALTLKIKANIDSNQHQGWKNPGDPLVLPADPVAVEFPPAVVRAVRAIADKKAQEFSVRGIRLLLQLRSLVKAHALLRAGKRKGKVVATLNEDAAFLRRIYPYLDWEKAGLL